MNVSSLKTKLIDLLTAGQHNRLDRITERSVQLAVLYSLVGIVQFFSFAAYFLHQGRIYHGLSLIFFPLFLIASYLYLRVSGNHRFYLDMVIAMMALFCLYMICLGGAHSSGPLWAYFIPLLASYLQGLRRGGITVAVMFTAILIILYGPWAAWGIAAYPSIFKVRFLGSFTMVCLMAFTYEYSRSLAHKELVELSQRLDRAARTDELTGLSNRRDMKEKLIHETQRAARNRKPFCIMLADIDDFKQVNDIHGHDVGDLTLQALSRSMTAVLRSQDVVSRWGGEEFLMMLPETDIHEGRLTATRLLDRVSSQPLSINGDRLRLTISIGLAQYNPADDLEKTIIRADRALYQAKANGKNRVEG